MKPHSILNNIINLINNKDYLSPCALTTGQNEAFGIYDDNGVGIQIRENTISYTPDYNTFVNDRNYGIIFHNTGACSEAKGRVRRNIINDLNYGITSMGNNKGIQVSCNQFDNTVSAPVSLINLYSSNSQDANCQQILNGNLESPQGNCIDLTSPAGNKFTDCSLGVDRFLTAPVVNQIRYSEHTNSPYQVELCMTGDIVPDPCSSPCPDHDGCCPLDVIEPFPTKDVLKDNIETFKTERQAKTDMIDGGNTQALLDMVNNPINSAIYLLQEMLDLGNYISDEVLIAVINKTPNAFSNFELTQLILANSPVTERVYNVLDETRPIVANNYNVWIAQQSGLSDRDQLEGQINQLQALEDRDLVRLVIAYIDEGNADSAIVNLLLFGYKEQALPILVEAQNFILAQSIINTFSDADLRTVYNIDLSYKMIEQTIKSISNSDREVLIGVKHKSTPAGIFARNMLDIANGTFAAKVMPPIPSPSASRKKQRVLNYDKFMPENNYAVYPNPSKGILNIISYSTNFTPTTEMVLTDLAGKVIYKTNLNIGKSKSIIALPNIAKGPYLLTIYENNKKVYQTKHQISE
jgi:hypothetical protein